MDKRLTGRTALVTGGAVRLGQAVVLRLADEGAAVGIHYCQSSEAARKTLSMVSQRGVDAAMFQADLAADVPEMAARLFDTVEERLGPVQLLVNNAAIFESGTLLNTNEASWDRQFALNLKAPVWLAHEFARRLPSGMEGAIINIADWRGVRPVPGHLAYTLTKSGILALTKILAQELAPQIRVNAIAPGALLPPSQGDVQQWDRLRERIPLRRCGHPDDLADAVLYLASTRFVTGEVLCLTGGEEL